MASSNLQASTNRGLLLQRALACVIAACATATNAAPVQVNIIHMFRDIRGINDLGFPSGDRWQFGATIEGSAARR